MTQFSWLVISIVAGIVGLGIGFLLGAAVYPEDNGCDGRGGCDNCCGDISQCDGQGDKNE